MTNFCWSHLESLLLCLRECAILCSAPHRHQCNLGGCVYALPSTDVWWFFLLEQLIWLTKGKFSLLSTSQMIQKVIFPLILWYVLHYGDDELSCILKSFGSNRIKACKKEQKEDVNHFSSNVSCILNNILNSSDFLLKANHQVNETLTQFKK